MTQKIPSLGLCLLVAFVWAVPLAWSEAAHAATVRPVSGSAQFYIGSGLPIPNRLNPGEPASCVPNGGHKGIPAIPGAKVTTTGGPKGGSFKLMASQFTFDEQASVRGVKTQNPVALQVYTNFTIAVPGVGGDAWDANTISMVPFGGKGRTGANVVTWCPGYTATVKLGNNPGCPLPTPIQGGANHKAVNVFSCAADPAPCPGAGKKAYVVPGYIKYTRTGKMLGGPTGGGSLGGTFNVAIGVANGVAFVSGTPPSKGQFGQAFGNVFQKNNGKGPVRTMTPLATNACGIIQKIGILVAPSAESNRTKYSFGAPWTQGMITVYMDTGAGKESYKIAGYDNRITAKTMNWGKGNIQLVSASLGTRSLTGENANRGFLRLEVPEPATIAGALGALLVLAGCHQVVRRRSK